MAITITGGKYAAAALNAAGTTTVTVSGTPFVSGDFSVARRVDLYNSAGTTFKGTAFVRQFNSTSQLQLETEFFDPKTGATVNQVVGDTVLVSKNWADVVQAGITISNNVVTVSDTITFGTNSTVNSCAFHDEGQLIQNTVTTSDAKLYVCAGGYVTFGHLQNWAQKSWYDGCQFIFNNTASFVGSFSASSTAARLNLFGGSHRGSGLNPLYFGAGSTSVALYGTDWAHIWCLETQFDASDILSTNGGGDWSTGSNHVLESCSFVGAGTNQILVRWGNGSVIGGNFKVLRNSSSPISIFGSDSAGTYELGAPAGQRAVVLDVGQTVLWRTNNNGTVQTVNCTNLISTDYRCGYSTAPEALANTSATKNVYFKDSYTNLQDATALGIIRNADWSLDDSATASGAASPVSMRAFHSTGTGHSLGAQRGPWTYRIRKYGYDELEGSIAESSYSLGTAGTAFDVTFGGGVNQIARASLTGSAATALAIAGITVSDHGASPVTWNSKQWSITVTVDLATYPARTAAEVFRHIKAGIAQTATWNGKAGILWHVLMEEGGTGYITQRGASGGAGATLKGVRIIDQAGNHFPGMASMMADDGTTYIPPVAITTTLVANVSLVSAEVRIYDLDDTPAGSFGTELSGTESCSSASYVYSGNAGNLIRIQVMQSGYVEFGQDFTIPASDSTLNITLTPDANE